MTETIKPRSVVAIRDEIQRWCMNYGDGMLRWDSAHIVDAELIWVSPALTELVIDAANTVPDDLHLTDITSPPFVSALVVFSKGLQSIDGVSGKQILVDGILWGPIHLQGQHGIHLAISSYGTHVPEFKGSWVYLGRSDWMLHQTVGDVEENLGFAAPTNPVPSNNEALAASMIEDRRLIVALWQVMNMKHVVEHRTWTPMNKSAKRRTGKGSRVQVLDLLQSSHSDAHASEGKEGNFHVRWWVRPHWRWQAYGPGRQKRRLTLVSGHVKGPEDAPFVKKNRVWRMGDSK